MVEYWKFEQKIAKIHGWDFSHIEGKYSQDDRLCWDYREEILKNLTSDMKILDIDTGGGEFLLSLGHDPKNTAATENYPPNIELCKKTLLPLGIDFKEADAESVLPFDDKSFDMVINRHGSFNPCEIYRVLKTGGLFITQQVGAYNDRELVTLLCGNLPLAFANQTLGFVKDEFEKCGFLTLDAKESFGDISFFDVGALVWFARIIEWEFKDFSVENNIENLLMAQKILEKEGRLSAKTHRFFLKLKK